MKGFFLLTLAAALLAGLNGCSKKARLSGSVALEDGAKLLLMNADNSQAPAVDTAVVLNGLFEFKGAGYEDGLYVVVTPEHDTHLVYLSEEPAEVFISVEDSTPSMVKQGKHAALLNEYYVAGHAFGLVTTQCRADMAALQLDSTVDQVAGQEAIENKWIEAEGAYVQKLWELATSHANNPISLYLFRWVLQSGETEKLAEMGAELDKWDGSLDGHPLMVFLRKQIATEAAIALGNPFVDFTVANADGEPAKLSDVAGKGNVVLVEFWASWCRYCRMANPDLVGVYNAYSKKGFDIFGVSLDRDKDEWAKAVADDKLPWPQYVMMDGVERPSDLYNVRGIPFNVLLDGEGKIVAKSLSAEELSAKLAEMLQ